MEKRRINIRPICVLGVFSALGIVVGYLNLIYGLIAIGVALAIGVLSFLVALYFRFKSNKSLNKFSILSLLSLLLSVGFFFYFTATVNRFKNANVKEESYVIHGVICDINYGDEYVSLTIDDLRLDGKGNGHKMSVTVTKMYNNLQLKLGDEISFISQVSNTHPYYYGDISADSIIADKKYRSSVDYRDIKVFENSGNLFQKANQFIMDTLKKGTSKDVFPIYYAMITGNSSLIEEGTLKSFRYSGIAHIFAVSGLHIGIIAGALSFIFRKLSVKKYISAPIIITLLFLFSGVCGFSPSSIRASVMCAISLIAGVFGQKSDMLTNISLSSIIVLSISPVYLFDVGFRMSYACVTAIAIGSAPLKNLLERLFKGKCKKLVDGLSVSILASLGTAPISIYYFGSTPLLAILFNLVFIPILSTLFVFMIISLLLSMITTACGVFLYLPNVIMKGITFILKRADASNFTLSGIQSDEFLIFYFLFIFICAGMIAFSVRYRRALSVILASVFIIGSMITTNVYVNTGKLYMFNDSLTDCVYYSKDNEDYLFISGDGKYTEFKKVNALMDKLGVKKIDYVFINYGTKSMPSLYLNLKESVNFDKLYMPLTMNFFDFYDANYLMPDRYVKVGNIFIHYQEQSQTALVKLEDKLIAIAPEFEIERGARISNEKIDLLIFVNERKLYLASNNISKCVGMRYEKGCVSAYDNGNLNYLVKKSGIVSCYKLQNVR